MRGLTDGQPYATEYKKFFTQLQDDDYAEALVVRECRNDFRRVASMYDNNPYY